MGIGANCLSNRGTAITLHSSLPRVNTISLGQTLSIKNLDPVADGSTVLIYESDYPLRATPCSYKSGLSTHMTHDSYTYKFSRDVSFAAFAGNLSSMKFKSS